MGRNHERVRVAAIVAAAVAGAFIFPANAAWAGSKADCDQSTDIERSIRGCTALIKRNPSDATAYYNRGNDYYYRRDYVRAIADYSQSLKLSPNNTDALDNIAIAYIQQGEYDRAVTSCTQAIRLKPKGPVSYSVRGTAYFKIGNYERAVADHSQAIQLMPKNDVLYSDRADAYREMGALDKALADYDHAIKLAPREGPPYTGRGLVHEKQGDLSAARKDYNKAVSLPMSTRNIGGPAAYQLAQERLAVLESDSGGATIVTAEPAVQSGKPAADESPPRKVIVMGRRAALVIGNSDYQNAPRLANPVNDARAIAGSLGHLGFDVTYKENLDAAAMRAALGDFEDKSSGADWAVVYYAGHGMQIDGRTWLIPVDARLKRVSDAPDEAVPLDRVLDRVRPAAQLRMVLLDACRDNPFLTRMDFGKDGQRGNVGRGLARVEPQHGELVFYAARDGQTAQDGAAQHSPFATALLTSLDEPGLELGRFVRRVTSDVLSATATRQEPFVYGRLPDKDFYFKAP